MKKSVIAVLVAVLVLSSCGNSKSNPETKSLYTQGLEVIQLMTEIIKTKEYINTIATDSLKPIIQELADEDYSTPKAVYSISASDKELVKLTEFNGFDSIPDNLKPFISSKLNNSLINMINNRGGIEDVAVASICSAGKTFVNENVSGNILYLYTYDDTVPIAVAFTTGDDNSVSANGVFVMNNEFKCNSADEIKNSFNHITVEVTEIKPEK